MVPSIGREYVVRALPRFAARHPELTVVATLNDQRVALVRDGIDVALFPRPAASRT